MSSLYIFANLSLSGNNRLIKIIMQLKAIKIIFCLNKKRNVIKHCSLQTNQAETKKTHIQIPVETVHYQYIHICLSTFSVNWFLLLEGGNILMDVLLYKQQYYRRDNAKLFWLFCHSLFWIWWMEGLTVTTYCGL